MLGDPIAFQEYLYRFVQVVNGGKFLQGKPFERNNKSGRITTRIGSVIAVTIEGHRAFTGKQDLVVRVVAVPRAPVVSFQHRGNNQQSLEELFRPASEGNLCIHDLAQPAFAPPQYLSNLRNFALLRGKN